MASLGQVFSRQVKERTALPQKRVTEWIHYSKLCRSKRQYCDAKDREEIENLADLIQADGEVLQNLLVRKHDADSYEIIAGHKRTLACRLLTEERGLEGFAFLPCFIKNESEAKTRLSIISSNAHHEKTQYEIMHEIKELEYLFTHYPEEFGDDELRGRMVERIGRKVGKSRSVVTEYLSISKKLGEAGMQEFKAGRLSKDAAKALSALPEKEQEKALEMGMRKSEEIAGFRKKLQGKSKPEESFVEKKGKGNVPESGTGGADGEEQLPGQIEIANIDMHTREVQVPSIKQNSSFVLKNMKEREEFLLNYKSWQVWTRNYLTEETFYRFGLPDGSFIVVKSYPCFVDWKKEEQEREEFYLLEPGYRHFNDCRSNLTSLKEHLKEVLGR